MPEVQEKSQQYLPKESAPRYISTEQFLQEAGEKAGRFNLPFSFRERLQLQANKMFLRLNLVKDIPLALDSSIPIKWQILLNYLYRHGIAAKSSFQFSRGRNDKPKMATAYIPAHHDPGITDALAYKFGGYASGGDAELLMSRAIGELLERYFGTVFKRKTLLTASTEQMARSQKRFFNPANTPLYTPEQQEAAPSLKVTGQSVFSWELAKEIISDTEQYIPAQLVYWLYNRSGTTEPLLYPATTNGSAGHFSRNEAIVSAIRELVERDAFLIYWLNTLSPKRIDLASWEDEEVQQKLHILRRYNITPYLLNATTDIAVPVSICVLIQNEGNESLMAVGASAAGTAKASFLKSLSEALTTLSMMDMADSPEEIDFATYKPFSEKSIDRDGRVRLWRGPKMYEKMRFFISGELQSIQSFESAFKIFSTPKEELDFLRGIFKEKGPGYEIYAHFSQNPVLRKLGYHIARAIIPELVPMYLNENMAPLAARRLAEVPAKLGFPKTERNTCPHPFP